jgi:hypothetical protein
MASNQQASELINGPRYYPVGMYSDYGKLSVAVRTRVNELKGLHLPRIVILLPDYRGNVVDLETIAGEHHAKLQRAEYPNWWQLVI